MEMNYEVDEFVETEGDYPDFCVGNGYWWQSAFVNKKGYGFGFSGNFTDSDNICYERDSYNVNLIFVL